MTPGLAFWILMLIWLVFSGWGLSRSPAEGRWLGAGPNLLLFVLLVILGWHAFGAPIK